MPAVIAFKPIAKPAFTPMNSTSPKFEVTCASCNLRELCLPGGVCAEDLDRVENIVYARRRVKRGEALFGVGDEFRTVYAIRSGFFMGGELLGMDGLGSGRYNGTAIALEDSEVCVMPYALIEQMAREVPSLQRHLHSVLAREIVRDHGVMMLLGSMRAEERLAAFLINLSKRFVRRGYSASDFHLRMTRDEIGSYLGLKLETVSRLFSQFQKDGLIEVEQKHVRILDSDGLERLLHARS